jgi:hypothetical protein
MTHTPKYNGWAIEFATERNQTKTLRAALCSILDAYDSNATNDLSAAIKDASAVLHQIDGA